jgi:CBS domain-containing protein
MITTHKPLTAMKAGDLMTRDVTRLPAGMPLRDAVRLLLDRQISGAPVVDAAGKCVGVFSAIDFLRLGRRPEAAGSPRPEPSPVTCSFQVKHARPDGTDVTLCLLPPGMCSLQVRQAEPGGEELQVCGQPNCVLTDWQVVEVEQLPTDGIRQHMTPDPVTARPDTPIRDLARLMIDAHIHRLIVVDGERRPLGVVSSTDLLAALARADE